MHEITNELTLNGAAEAEVQPSMSPQDYLTRCSRLERRIRLLKAECAHWRELMAGMNAPAFGERVKASRDTDAGYTKLLEKLTDCEEKLDQVLQEYLQLKEKLGAAIDAVADPDERLVLHYHYICGFSFQQIAEQLCVTKTTVYRRHQQALEHFMVPVTITENGGAA